MKGWKKESGKGWKEADVGCLGKKGRQIDARDSRTARVNR